MPRYEPEELTQIFQKKGYFEPLIKHERYKRYQEPEQIEPFLARLGFNGDQIEYFMCSWGDVMRLKKQWNRIRNTTRIKFPTKRRMHFLITLRSKAPNTSARGWKKNLHGLRVLFFLIRQKTNPPTLRYK